MNEPIPVYEVLYSYLLPSGRRVLLRADNGSALYVSELAPYPLTWDQAQNTAWFQHKRPVALAGFFYKGRVYPHGSALYDKKVQQLERSLDVIEQETSPSVQVVEKEVYKHDWRLTVKWVVYAVVTTVFVLLLNQAATIAAMR